MMNSKKAESLSMNVIIIAAIALLVLVIIAVLLFQSAGRTTKGLSCDPGLSGRCTNSDPSTSDQKYIRNPAFDSTCSGYQAGAGDSNPQCWVPLG